jgi:hypothetical protein
MKESIGLSLGVIFAGRFYAAEEGCPSGLFVFAIVSNWEFGVYG